MMSFGAWLASSVTGNPLERSRRRRARFAGLHEQDHEAIPSATGYRVRGAARHEAEPSGRNDLLFIVDCQRGVAAHDVNDFVGVSVTMGRDVVARGDDHRRQYA